MLGKRVAGSKKKAEDAQAVTKKRQHNGMQLDPIQAALNYIRGLYYEVSELSAGAASAADAQHAAAEPKGQQKLSAFFKPGKPLTPKGAEKPSVAQSTPAGASASHSQAVPTLHKLPEQQCYTVFTRIVGRQHQDTEQAPPCPGEDLLLLREPDNPVDPCAILVGHQRVQEHSKLLLKAMAMVVAALPFCFSRDQTGSITCSFSPQNDNVCVLLLLHSSFSVAVPRACLPLALLAAGADACRCAAALAQEAGAPMATCLPLWQATWQLFWMQGRWKQQHT